MRRSLDLLYAASGISAAGFLMAIFVIVLLQVGANILDYCISLFLGNPIGLVVPSYAEIAGFFLAASSFLALPYAFRHGSHIRVTLVLMHLPRKTQVFMSVAVCLVGGVVSAFLSWYVWELIRDSYEFGDLSSGLIAVPLWIPQTPIAVGAAILAIAMVDSAVRLVLDGHDTACDLGAGGE
ncbi:MAG: TRAP transporter small permease [Rhodospirillaceae bacterium]|nr:TRAP transporter small permease [Rhodospirillaceae bacterium]